MHTVTFKVKTLVGLGRCSVFVVGNCPELGNWVPNLATPLSLHSSSRTEDHWSGQICVKSTYIIEYRFFIGCALRESENSLVISTQSWESFELPRTVTLSESESEIDCGEVTYGCDSNGQVKVNSGWLTGQSEVQLRLSNLFIENIASTDVFVGCVSMETKQSVASRSNMSTLLCSPVFYTAFGVDGPNVMPQNGIKFDVNNGFLTLKVQTCLVNQMTLKIVLSTMGDAGCLVEVGNIFLKPSSGNKAEVLQMPIVTKQQELIGSLNIDILVIDSLKDVLVEGCFVPRHWRQDGTSLTIGHRGMGSTFINGVKSARFPENTIQSFTEASKNGADMIEFDVLLTRDEIPVIFHDFTGRACAVLPDNKSSLPLEVSVVDLTLQQLQSFKVQKCLDSTYAFPSADDERPFPTLQSCFEKVDPNMAFDVEVKYCMNRRDTKKLEDGLNWFPERNKYVDVIISTILQHAGNRLIILSCFDPDVCVMLQAKQARFPVVFLSQGETKKYPAYLDPRASTLRLAIEFAAAESLAGIAVHSEGLLKDMDLITCAKSRDLAVFCWGTDNNSVSNLSLLRSSGIDGICYDRIDEFKVPVRSSLN